MSLYITRNPHKTALRHHHYKAVQPAEKQPHPADKFEWGIRSYMVTLVVIAAALSFGWVAI